MESQISAVISSSFSYQILIGTEARKAESGLRPGANGSHQPPYKNISIFLTTAECQTKLSIWMCNYVSLLIGVESING